MAYIALKVDVDTLRGTREGVPALARMLCAHQAGATFLFSLGPDHTGRALRRIFRPGFLKKVSRTSVLRHYGLYTLLYGVLLPGPDIGRQAAAEMRAVANAGFETGLHAWDHVLWQDHARTSDDAWTTAQMDAAYARFAQIFGRAPRTHGAAGWQMNDHAFRRIDAWGMAYASDGRGARPYIPSVAGQALAHVQLPTTLPTLDECIGLNRQTPNTVARHLLKMTESDLDQVFTLHAELEGQKLAPIFEQLLQGWRAQGHRLVGMGDYHATLNPGALPVQPVAWGEIPGRSGSLIVQPA